MLFCSTHPTEKVWRQIYIEEKLLFQVRYYVVPKCGTTNQMGGGGEFSWSMKTKLCQYLL